MAKLMGKFGDFSENKKLIKSLKVNKITPDLTSMIQKQEHIE
jgi:hypothetical protein